MKDAEPPIEDQGASSVGDVGTAALIAELVTRFALAVHWMLSRTVKLFEGKAAPAVDSHGMESIGESSELHPDVSGGSPRRSSRVRGLSEGGGFYGIAVLAVPAGLLGVWLLISAARSPEGKEILGSSWSLETKPGIGGRERIEADRGIRSDSAWSSSSQFSASADAMEMAEAVFVGGYSRYQIRSALERTMSLYGVPVTEGNRKRVASTLLVLRKETGSPEMRVLALMVRMHVPNLKFSEGAALAAWAIAKDSGR